MFVFVNEFERLARAVRKFRQSTDYSLLSIFFDRLRYQQKQILTQHVDCGCYFVSVGDSTDSEERIGENEIDRSIDDILNLVLWMKLVVIVYFHCFVAACLRESAKPLQFVQDDQLELAAIKAELASSKTPKQHYSEPFDSHPC